MLTAASCFFLPLPRHSFRQPAGMTKLVCALVEAVKVAIEIVPSMLRVQRLRCSPFDNAYQPDARNRSSARDGSAVARKLDGMYACRPGASAGKRRGRPVERVSRKIRYP